MAQDDDKDLETLDRHVSRIMIELEKTDLPDEVREGLTAELSIVVNMRAEIAKAKR